MSQLVPLTVTEWREYLRAYSADFFSSDYLREAEADGRAQWMVSPAQRAAGWLGYEPASEQMLAETEHRLGVRLPASYRNFLLVSNGWSTIRYWFSPIDLLRADEIGWMSDLEPELIDAFDGVYSDEEIAMLKRCLLISSDDGGSGGNWMLHADGDSGKGEWEACEWWPGEGGDLEREDNFAAMATWRRTTASP